MLTSARAFGFPDNDLVIHGPDGRLRAQDTVWEDLGGTLELTTAAGSQRFSYPDDATDLRLYTDQVERFGRSVLGAGEPAASGEDGLAAAQVTAAIQRSAAIGRTVRIDEIDPGR